MRGLVVALAVGVVAGPAAATSQYETYGTAPADQAEGGAGTASPSSYSAVHHNPAGLTLVERPLFMVGTRVQIPRVEVTFDRTPELEAQLPDVVGATTIGLVVPGYGLLKDRAAVGAGVLLPTRVLTRLSNPDPLRPAFFQYGDNIEHYEANLAGAVRAFDIVHLGAGVRFAAGQSGVLFADVDPLRGRITRQEFDAWQYSLVAPNVGAVVGPVGIDGLTVQVGAAAREELTQPVQVPVSINFDELDADVFAAVVAQSNFMPRTLSLGIAATITPAAFYPPLSVVGPLELKASVHQQYYSRTPTPFASLRVNGGGPGIEALGLGALLDVPRDDAERVGPPGFVDTVQWRAGAKLGFLDELAAVRVGYSYRPSPVPDQEGATNIIDANVHALSAGLVAYLPLSPLFDGDLIIDMAWQTHILAPRRTEKVRADDPIGPWTVSGMVHCGELALGYRF